MKKGYFGDFGGQFIPELLMPPLIELEEAMETILPSEAFQSRFAAMLKENVGRPSAITYCPNLSRDLGLDLWLKREDLNHSGAHKINNTLGQGLLAKMMGKKVLLAETGAGMHGVATTVAAAMLDMKAVIYMGATDVVRQAPNVNRMRLMGAEIIAVESGTKTLKDAINEALRRWLSDQETTHYCFGTAAGPHPFPTLVREFQQIISKEAREQFMTRNQGKLPDVVVACVGGGSNAIGMFHNFVPDESVKLVGVEAAGTGEPGCYSSAPIDHGTEGVLHGMKTKLLQTPEGQIEPSHSVAAGLDYPGVGPEHAHLDAIGRVDYTTINDTQAINAFKVLSRREGIIPALESSHAVAYAIENRDKLQGQSVLVCLSGRGDKDLGILDEIL
ncbi:tryptophan synthase subunit beta [Pseudodesulfovibrio thermohalotolerans]|uniref:tryptophan synthase subunit beta n=1 Tax=Pseudodesulfovibrio thermohalotolerans TaxID=2880651 RepID=UPI002442BFE2|nr:tryptophan synthase subunit beta [Pseudodesulfovibrio thermohalotolerans]WFS63481.1 tryptophan synthase subunit beta [Pseudodesulfovibrio thermohalotolerans]